MKIAVYAICKNEEKFIEQWIKNVYDADEIILCDTGSTDNTIKIAKKYKKVKIFNINISPWRFDLARNVSLSLVSKDVDVCVCTDLDELLCDDWRKLIESSWNKDTTKLKYTYNWSHDDHGNPNVTFLYEKIHSRFNYQWRHPVHEVLYYYGETPEQIVINEKLTLDHYPDTTKSRGSYLPLLELSVKLYPSDDRNMFYLGREYTFYQQWEKAIDTFKKHLALPSATWNMERSCSYRLLAKSYRMIGKYEEAILACNNAIMEYSNFRENYVELADIYATMKDFKNALDNIEQALTIVNKEKVYMNEPSVWDATIYDKAALYAYYSEQYEKAYNYGTIACNMSDDPRIHNNLVFYKQKTDDH